MEPDGPRSEQQGAGSPAEEDGERFGPLRLQRLTKEDGRMLILYVRVDPTDSGEE
jgi:hypothetical protein